MRLKYIIIFCQYIFTIILFEILNINGNLFINKIIIIKYYYIIILFYILCNVIICYTIKKTIDIIYIIDICYYNIIY